MADMALRYDISSKLAGFDQMLERALVSVGSVAGKGSFKLASGLVRSMSSKGALTTVRLNDDSMFAFPLGDNYWSKAFFLKRAYESEIGSLLKAARDVPFNFIDCGANFGYWSVLVSSREYGAHPVVAVELAETNIAVLKKNAGLNRSRFDVLHRAVFSQSGETLKIFGKNHFGFTVSPNAAKRGDAQEFSVATTTLDGCMEMFDPGSPRDYVVKLDVEGAELDAMRGAPKLLRENVMFLYEDEKLDAAHELSAALMNEFDLKLFAIRPDRAPAAIQSLADVTSAKASGIYNFAAVPRGSDWLGVLSDARMFQEMKP
jgi:FkbM family methyltransferase